MRYAEHILNGSIRGVLPKKTTYERKTEVSLLERCHLLQGINPISTQILHLTTSIAVLAGTKTRKTLHPYSLRNVSPRLAPNPQVVDSAGTLLFLSLLLRQRIEHQEKICFRQPKQ